MNILSFPELFYLISANLNDKEKILLTLNSKKTYGFQSLIRLDLEYDLKELIGKSFSAKNIIMKKFSLETKELINNLIPESITIHLSDRHFKCARFVSNNTNIKLFYELWDIQYMVLYEHHYLAMKMMLNNDNSIENINSQLIESSNSGYLEVIKLLIDLGADVQYDNNKAIIKASKNGRFEAVKLLIESGADIHAQNNLAIICASENGRLEAVKLLIKYGANVQAQNNLAIIYASYGGHLQIIKLLIESGADIHAQNNRAIIEASSKGHIKAIKLLIDSGADIHAQNNKALIMARYNNCAGVVQLLIENGAKN